MGARRSSVTRNMPKTAKNVTHHFAPFCTQMHSGRHGAPGPPAIYPSIFEGFGIPVLEALWSKIPVITSNISSLPEAGGDAALYVDPLNEEQMDASDEEEDPLEREPASEDWEDKEVILEEPEMGNNMEVGQNFGGWMESYD